MSFKNSCLSCFVDKGNSAICSHCGFDEAASERGPLFLPPRRLLNNQYLIGRPLGSPGGFGLTYLAFDIHLHVKVAIKEFLPRELVARQPGNSTVAPHTAKDKEIFDYGLGKFVEEARLLAQFSHPNIVRVRTFLQENGTAYLVMEYYEGESLQEYLESKGGRIPERLARDLMMPVMDGLREAHGAGVLHRDVKPANIYITKGGIPILLDFGAARVAMGERSRSLSVVLTPGFAPFEQYTSKGKQGPWTDVYACGATLYYLVTGNAPPDAADRQEEDDIVPVDRNASGVSRQFSDAVMGALALRIKDRPQTMKEFQDVLLGQKVEDPAPPPKPKPAEPEPLKEPTKADVAEPKPVIASLGGKKIAIGIAAVTALIVSGYLLFSGKSAPSGMVFVKGGCFDMGDTFGEGDDDEKPVHRVCVDDFRMDQYEVTQGEFEKVMGNNPSYFKDCGGDCPVENVTWFKASDYCRKVSKRLPTEAEWEYAAREGGEKVKYGTGSNSISSSSAKYDSSGGPVSAGSFAPNGLGLYDMSGNVWEWVSDWYDKDYYKRSPEHNPKGPGSGEYRVLRGGGWSSDAIILRVALRSSGTPTFRGLNSGFRCAQ